MLKKKILACVLVFALLFLTACGGDAAEKNAEEDVKVFGATESKDPLRICVDLQDFGTSNVGRLHTAMYDFWSTLKNTGKLEDVVIEYIPSPRGMSGDTQDVSARAAAIDRIRAEIMAGEGPDVFLMTYMVYHGPMGCEYDETDILFKYPEKAMANGVFLPLDEYIENNTQFAEWDKFTKPVMDAGRNEEGQQIIPLTYTFPLLCYPKSEWEHTPDKSLTWNDLLSDPELSVYGKDLANCSESFVDFYTKEELDGILWHMRYILGKYADYESEELLFTEEELLQRVNEILLLDRKDRYTEVEGACERFAGIRLAQREIDKPTTFLPLYSDDGGIVASIENFAAVNRNTDRPEDAFTVIDLLMSKHLQQSSAIYTDLLYNKDSIPMHEELFQESAPLATSNYFMTEENFEAFCTVREQLTGANFEAEWMEMLDVLLAHCRNPEPGTTVETYVHEFYEDMQRRVRE